MEVKHGKEMDAKRREETDAKLVALLHQVHTQLKQENCSVQPQRKEKNLVELGALDLSVRSLNGDLLCTLQGASGWKVIDVCKAVSDLAGIPVLEQTILVGSVLLNLADDLSVAPGLTDITLLRRSQEQVEWLRKLMDSEDCREISCAPASIQEDFTMNLVAVRVTDKAWPHVRREFRCDAEFLRAAGVASAIPMGVATDQDFLLGCARLRAAGGFGKGAVRGGPVSFWSAR